MRKASSIFRMENQKSSSKLKMKKRKASITFILAILCMGFPSLLSAPMPKLVHQMGKKMASFIAAEKFLLFSLLKAISRLFSEKPAVSLEAVAAGAAIGAGSFLSYQRSICLFHADHVRFFSYFFKFFLIFGV